MKKSISILLGTILGTGLQTAAHGHQTPTDRCRTNSFGEGRRFVEPITPFGAEVAGEEIVVVGADGEEYVVGEDDMGEELVGADSVERLLAAAVSGEALDGIGARRRRVARRGGMRVMKRAIKAPIHVPGQKGELITTSLGFDSLVDIVAGAALPVQAIPGTDFWGRKLIVPSDIAGNFALIGAQVGMKNVLPGVNQIPLRAYDERSNGGSFLLPVCRFGYPITLNVINIGGGPARFRAMIEGKIREQ